MDKINISEKIRIKFIDSWVDIHFDSYVGRC